jgi:hypothetical protein
MLTDTAANHAGPDSCIRALRQEIETLRQALEKLTPDAVDRRLPEHADRRPSGSRQTKTRQQ